MSGRPPKYPFRELQVGEIRAVTIPWPAGVDESSHNIVRATMNELTARLASAIRQHHFRRPERFTYTVTYGPNGPIAHIRRYQ